MRGPKLHAYLYHGAGLSENRDAIFLFRKALFVDQLGWSLACDFSEERDEFDRDDTIHCALYVHDALIGGFRAIRCDRPYLGRCVFPHLATTGRYPVAPNYWEISRFGVFRTHREHGLALYALMFSFAEARKARALVAIADLGHERLLRRIGINTHRYGPPAVIGADRWGTPIEVVAGEIPIAEQDASRLRFLKSQADEVEISDETLVLGPTRVYA
jgi:acyl homoserine lactone synthase